MNERECLQVLIGFKETLDGAVPLGAKVQIASECAKIESFFAAAGRQADFSEDAKAGRETLHLFIKSLPEFDDKNFKKRRQIIDTLKEVITHSARLVATSNKIERKKTQ